MTRVLWIRHGQTDWNVQGRWQGHADEPLNAQGLNQARVLADFLRGQNTGVATLISSDLSRARTTAEAIGSALGLTVRTTRLLRELDMGQWSGMTREEITGQYSEEMTLLRAGYDLPRGGGETFARLRSRVAHALDLVLHHHAGHTIAIVTHGGPVRAALQLAGVEAYFGKVTIDNASLTVLRHDRTRWHVEKLNDTAHLTTLAPAIDMMAPAEGQA